MQSTTGNSDNGGGMRSELRSDAQQIGSSARNRLHSEIDARKGSAADQAKSVSTAINRAAGELDDDSPQWLKSAFQQGADQVRRLADTLEQKDSREIVQDLRTLARDNPGVFLAGCAALGFAASRVFRAGAAEGSPAQASKTSYPPVQGEEPKFRSHNTDGSRSSAPAGEFA